MATYYVHMIATVEANSPEEANAIVNGQVLVNDFDLVQEVYTSHVEDDEYNVVLNLE